MRWALLLVVAAVACFGTGHMPGWKSGEMTPQERGHAKWVAAVRVYNTYDEWTAAPWFRTGDSPGNAPVFVIVASDRTACLVPASDWAVANPQDQYPCRSEWRIARP